MNQDFNARLPMVAVAALLIRLLPLPFVARILPVLNSTGFGSDGTDYYLPMARTLAEHGEFGLAPGQPTAFHVPLYPLLLAGLHALHLSSPLAIAVVQAILGSAALVLVFAWVNQLAGTGAALSAFAMAAVLPDFAVYSYFNMSETLSIVLVLAALLVFEEALRRDVPGLWALAGALLGLAALVREFSVTLLVPLTGAAVVRAGFRRVAGRALIMILAVALTILPWSIRNLMVFGEFIPLSTNSGRSVYVATLKSAYNLSDPRGGGEMEDPRQAERDRRLRQELEGPVTLNEGTRLFLKAAWQNYLDDPRGQLRHLAKKSVFFWQPNVGMRHAARVGHAVLLGLSEAAYWLCLAGMLSALLVWRRLGRSALVPCFLVVWVYVFHMFAGEAESRYHFALLPAVFALAGMFLATVFSFRPAGSWSPVGSAER